MKAHEDNWHHLVKIWCQLPQNRLLYGLEILWHYISKTPKWTKTPLKTLLCFTGIFSWAGYEKCDTGRFNGQEMRFGRKFTMQHLRSRLTRPFLRFLHRKWQGFFITLSLLFNYKFYLGWAGWANTLFLMSIRISSNFSISSTQKIYINILYEVEV